MMGAGKTSIGRQLAKRLQRRFVDVDHEIEAQTGVRIPTIFEIEGEAGFREREAQTIVNLAQQDGLVLATGGGAVLREANRRCLSDTGVVIYLRVPPQTLYERTRHDRNRPLLQVENPLQRIEELYVQRDPLYREIADITMDSGNCSVAALARRIEEELNSKCAP
ncbi:MAG: shikimate kinase [Rhodocyclaceae bacterium]|nr:shikimate kinase [Rhodocyclaceae bacterium]